MSFGILPAIAALLPILAYLGILQIYDAFSMTRWRRLASHALWGAAVTIITYTLVILWRYFHDGQPWTGLLPSILIEEFLKAIVLVILVSRRQIAFLAEAQIYGQAVGAGFAFVENILYLTHFPDIGIGTAIVRGMGTSMLHMGCTSTVVSLWLLMPWNKESQQYNIRWNYIFGTLLFIPSIAIHYVYNMWLFSPSTQLLCVIIIFLLIYSIVGIINERLTLRWLDLSIQTDIVLLQAIQEGRLCHTNSGKYLENIRERFEPLVFFDMCVYVQLYIEMLIAGKSRLMLRDAGLQVEMSQEEKTAHTAKLAELHAISARIPRVGHYLLRPILHTSVKNRWAMEH